MSKPKCEDCKWWDRNTDFNGKGKVRKCINPNAPGYKMWREYRNHLCKGFFEPKEET